MSSRRNTVLMACLALSFVAQSSFGQNNRSNGGRQDTERERPISGNQTQPPPPPPPPQCRPLPEEDALKEVKFHIDGANRFGQPSACLMSYDRWNDGDRRDWYHRSDRNYVEFEVSPACSQFNPCTEAQYNPGDIPSDNGKTWHEMVGSSQSFAIDADRSTKSTTLSIPSHENLVTRTYNLVNLPLAVCIARGQINTIINQWMPHPIFATGHAFSENVDRNCNKVREERRLDRRLPGLDLDTLIPQEWQSSESRSLIKNFSTDIVINVLPVDFPEAYSIRGSVSHTEGELAQISASSKYFEHSVQQVRNPKVGTQEFNLVSTLRPIASPNNTIVNYDAKNMVLTIQDNDLAELNRIDPNNQTKYQVAVYVNWNRVGSHQKLGNALANNPKALFENVGNKSMVSLGIKDELMAMPTNKDNSSYSKTLAKGGKDWAIYVEVSVVRSNKYIQSAPSSMSITEIKVNKKFEIGSRTPWSDMEKYRDDQK